MREEHISSSNIVFYWALTVLVVSTLFKITFCVVTITDFAFCLLHIFTYAPFSEKQIK